MQFASGYGLLFPLAVCENLWQFFNAAGTSFLSSFLLLFDLFITF